MILLSVLMNSNVVYHLNKEEVEGLIIEEKFREQMWMKPYSQLLLFIYFKCWAAYTIKNKTDE